MKLRLGPFPLAVFGLALILRLVPVLWALPLGIGLDDMFQYDMLARSILAGNGYRWYAEPDLALIQPYIDLDLSRIPYDPRGVETSFRPPLYPAFLALVYGVSGLTHRFAAARLVQALLGALLAPMTYAVGQRYGLGERGARGAALAVAGYPILVAYPLALVTENLFFPLVLASALALLRADEKNRPRDWFLAGLLLGLAALTRSVISLFALLAAGWALFSDPSRWTGMRNCLLVLAGILLLTLPWAARNTLLHGRPTFVESSLGYQMYLGYHPASTGTFNADIAADLLTIVDDAERNERGLRAVAEFIRADPARVPYLMVRKLGYFWGLEKRALVYFYSNNYFGPLPAWVLILALLLVSVPLALISLPAVVGLVFDRPRRPVTLVTLLLVGYILPHMLILAEDRFHLVLIPFLAVLAARGVAFLFRRAPMDRRGWKAGLAGALIASLLFNWGAELHADWPKLARLLEPGGHTLGFPY
ncbi:MAG: glycosyltransferase family 39 protein [Anaerolineae bacterium]|nr:glycosyltransferase family 39 protein [Anaerolineae bacterium]